MNVAFVLAAAAALGATNGAPDEVGERPPLRWELAVSAGPAWLGGRLGVASLSLDEALGPGGFLAMEGLVRLSPSLAFGASVEGIADAPAPASAPTCAAGAGRGCDAAYARFSALGRWTFHRSGTGEAWASGGTGIGMFRLASYGTATPARLELRGWEIATLAAGYDLGTRRLALGVYASATAGVLTHVTQGPEPTRAPGRYYAVRAGLRGAFRLGDPVAASPPLVVPADSALSLEPRLGIAVCGYCGLLIGGAATKRTGPWIGGAFVEGATVPVMDRAPPTQGSPSVAKAAAFLGLLAGAVSEWVGEWHRTFQLGLAAEGGAQASRANASFATVDGGSARSELGWFPFVGARVTVALRPQDDSAGTIGVAAFVRQPLWMPCMDVGSGCDRPTTTVGVAVQLSVDVRRGGAAAEDAPHKAAAAQPAP